VVKADHYAVLKRIRLTEKGLTSRLNRIDEQMSNLGLGVAELIRLAKGEKSPEDFEEVFDYTKCLPSPRQPQKRYVPSLVPSIRQKARKKFSAVLGAAEYKNSPHPFPTFAGEAKPKSILKKKGTAMNAVMASITAHNSTLSLEEAQGNSERTHGPSPGRGPDAGDSPENKRRMTWEEYEEIGKAIFKRYDLNGDGRINDEEELKQMCVNLLYKCKSGKKHNILSTLEKLSKDGRTLAAVEEGAGMQLSVFMTWFAEAFDLDLAPPQPAPAES